MDEQLNNHPPLLVKIHSLLSEGHTIRRTAELAKCSYQYVWKISRSLVSKGQLEPLNKYNTQFQVPLQIKLPTPLPASKSTNHPSMLPSNVGAVFALVVKPKGLQYNLGGMAYTEEKHFFKAQWGTHKVQIWLHSFKGSNPDEILSNARETLIGIASSLENKYHCKLTLLRWHNRTEWIDFSSSRSAKIAAAADLQKGERIEVAGALHKFSDTSHPDKIQFNPLKVPTIATDHAKIHHAIYSGEYERRFDILMESNERFSANLEKHLSVLDSMERRLGELGEAIRKLKEAKL